MVFVDSHCDTIYRIMCYKNDVICNRNSGLLQNGFHVDLRRMHDLGGYTQYFALYCSDTDPVRSMENLTRLLDTYFLQLEGCRDYVAHCNSYSDICGSLESGKVASILSIEGGEALLGDISVLRMMYRLGVRSIALTHNHSNQIADSAMEARLPGSVYDAGLTVFGREVVQEMNRLGMVIDVSHISDKAFFDIMEITDQPIIASHSNSRRLCGHPRNLSDDQIRTISSNGGVIGVNLFPVFLNNKGSASVRDVIAHIEYIAALAGIEHVGIGSDFDGIGSLPAGIRGVEDIHTIFNELMMLNYNQDDIMMISGLNHMRILQSVLR